MPADSAAGSTHPELPCVLPALGVAPGGIVRDDHRLTRQIGEAAYEQKLQAILTPSATGVDNVVAIFPENLAGSVLETELIEEWTTTKDFSP